MNDSKSQYSGHIMYLTQDKKQFFIPNFKLFDFLDEVDVKQRF